LSQSIDTFRNGGQVHVVANDKNEMVLRYAFTNFGNVNFNAIKEIGLFSETKFATGSHQIRIKNVRFTN
jgi:hypothetical protein